MLKLRFHIFKRLLQFILAPDRDRLFLGALSGRTVFPECFRTLL